MQVLFDVFPVIVFFVVYRFQGIYAATVAIIATMALQIAYQWFRYGKVNKMFLVSGIAVTILGGITSKIGGTSKAPSASERLSAVPAVAVLPGAVVAN